MQTLPVLDLQCKSYMPTNRENHPLRGRPLMIWGGAEEISKMNLFFPGNPFHIFSWRRASKFFFSRFLPAPPPDHYLHCTCRPLRPSLGLRQCNKKSILGCNLGWSLKQRNKDTHWNLRKPFSIGLIHVFVSLGPSRKGGPIKSLLVFWSPYLFPA